MKILLTIFIIIFLALGYLFFIQKQLINRVSVLESQSPYFTTTISPTLGETTGQDNTRKTTRPVLIGFREISGSISEIKDNRLVVLATVPMIVDFSSPIPPTMVERTYTVLIAKTTALNKISADDPKKTTSLSGIKEIRVGDDVSITALEDLQNKTEFTAKEITLFPK